MKPVSSQFDLRFSPILAGAVTASALPLTPSAGRGVGDPSHYATETVGFAGAIIGGQGIFHTVNPLGAKSWTAELRQHMILMHYFSR